MTQFTFEPSYNIDQFDAAKPKEVEYHFFGSNPLGWFASVDFKDVYDHFDEQGHQFSIFFVPTHAKKGYEINGGSPQGVGAHWLGTYHPK